VALALAEWPALESLAANECGLTGPGVSAFAESPLVQRIVSLQLSRNPDVPGTNWRVLCTAPMARLERLDLSSPGVTDDAIEALAANRALVKLRVLHLGAASATARCARAVLDSPHLRKLKRLRLPETHLDPALRARLRTAFGAGFNPRR
jgi:hypothetical protein